MTLTSTLSLNLRLCRHIIISHFQQRESMQLACHTICNLETKVSCPIETSTGYMDMHCYTKLIKKWYVVSIQND